MPEYDLFTPATAMLPHAAAEQNVADLRAVPATERVDKQVRLVEDKKASYRFDEQGVGTDDGDLIITPTVGSGRWFKIPSAGQPGSPGAETVIRTTDDIKAILEAAADDSSFWLEDGVHTTTGLITITSKRGITIQGGFGAKVTRSGSEAIFKIEGCEDLRMEGLSFFGTATGGIVIEIVDAVAGSYQIAKRHDYAGLRFDFVAGADGYSGIVSTGYFEFGTIRDCTFVQDIEDGISVSGANCAGTVIVYNRMVTEHSGGDGIHVGTTAGEGVRVFGNTVEGPFYTGIKVDDSEGVSVSGNAARYQTNFGILINATADRANVTNNIVYDSGGDGIAFNGDYGVVKGNEVYSAAGTGLACGGTEHSIIANNVIEDGAGWALIVDEYCSDLSLSVNRYNNNTSGTLSIHVDATDIEVDGKVLNQLATTSDPETTISLIPIPDDTAVWIEVSVVARRTDAAARAKWTRGALVYRESAGAATMEGSVWAPLTVPGATPYAVTIDTNGNNARVRVTGVAGHDVNWTSRHVVEERG